MPSDGKMPQNIDAERVTLGSLLIDRDAILLVREKLQPGDFYLEKHGTIYKAISDMSWLKTPADVVTLSDELERRGILDECGGREYLTSLIGDVPSASNIEYYADVVKRHGVARRIIKAAGGIAQIGYSSEEPDCDNLIAAADAELADLRKESRAQRDAVDNVDALLKVIMQQDELDKVYRESGHLFADTPWRSLNNIINGFRAGNLCIVAAAAAHGKSLFAECIAERNAQRGQQVYYFHLELTHDDMMRRQMCRLGNVTMWDLLRGQGDRSELARIGQVVSDWPGRVRYVHCPGATASWIASVIRRNAALNRGHLFIVDYLHKVTPEAGGGHGRSDEMNLATSVEILKNAAELAAVPIILLSQINTEYSGRGTKGPRLVITDLRGSGQVAEKANLVLMLWNESVFSQDDSINLVDCQIVKNTFGAQGKIQLRWQKSRFLFEDIVQRQGL